MKWQILDSGKASAQKNMDLDRTLLQELGSDPIFHLYDWDRPSATFGYFLQPDQFFNLPALQTKGFDVARRPTGGGVIFHDCDLAFSILIPAQHPAYSLNTLENYLFINRKVQNVIARFLNTSDVGLAQTTADGNRNFCMANPTQYDILIQGRKVGGAAQRQTKKGFLHQGSIFLGVPSLKDWGDVVCNGASIFDAINHTSCGLLAPGWTQRDLIEIRQKVLQELVREFIC